MRAVRIQRTSAGEAGARYDLLERDVVLEFYARDEQRIPSVWVARMRENMARLTPLFAARRAVRDDTAQACIRAAETYRARADEKGALGGHLVDWQQGLAREWPALRFGEMTVEVCHESI